MVLTRSVAPGLAWGKKARAGYAGYKAGLADFKVMCIGDSTTYGYNAGITANLCVAQSWPKQLAAILRVRGDIVAEDAVFASGGAASAATYDARITFSGTPPTQIGTAKTCGGWMFNWTATGAMAFTPARNIDTFVVYYLRRPTAGTFNLNIDGGSNTLVTATNGSFALGSQTMSAGSVGAHTLNLAWASGDILVIGVDAYDSTVKQIKLWGAGFYGSTSSDWIGTSNFWDPARIIRDAFQPHLIFVDLLINDWRGGVTDATSLSNMRALLDALIVNSDVVLVTPHPEVGVGTYSQAVQAAKIAIIQALGVQYKLPVIDGYGQWVDTDGTGTIQNGLGMYSDTIHLSKKGYADKAVRQSRFLQDFLLAA